VHKRKISYCVKGSAGKVYSEGSLAATRLDLDVWMKTLPQPWSAAMEATMFTGWIYDHLKPHAAALKVAHPLMLRAIAAAKKKNESYRRWQDLRLLAVRFSAGVLHGSDGDSRTKAHPALPQPNGAPDGADENQDQLAADGSRGEL
jgi:hypothetical protein